jgi:creatinine amidohydrolase
MLRRLLFGITALGLAAALLGCQPRDATTGGFSADGRVLKLEELTYPDIDGLDRGRTVFILTFGNLEEHGPHLPVGSDYFQAIGVRDGMVERLLGSHPEHTFVLVPVVPLGEGGFNDLARQFDHVGTFGTRFETLRDVTIDLGASIAAKGFENIFVIHSHGMPLHNVAFTQASAFVSERYDVRMVNITSLVFGPELYGAAPMTEHLGAGWEEEMGMIGHSGPAETSANLYLRGDLVKPDYRTLAAFTVADLDAMALMYEREEFRGYMSDPTKATPELGEDLVDDFADRAAEIATRALAGEDLSGLPIWPDVLPSIAEMDVTMQLLEQRYARTGSEFQAWLARQQVP